MNTRVGSHFKGELGRKALNLVPCNFCILHTDTSVKVLLLMPLTTVVTLCQLLDPPARSATVKVSIMARSKILISDLRL